MAGQGEKKDKGKPPMHLVAPEMIDALVERLEFGATKYAARNWEQGIAFSRLYGGMFRHMQNFWRGKDLDEDGLCNLSGVMINAAMIVALKRRGREDLDDRPTKISAARDGQGDAPWGDWARASLTLLRFLFRSLSPWRKKLAGS